MDFNLPQITRPDDPTYCRSKIAADFCNIILVHLGSLQFFALHLETDNLKPFACSRSNSHFACGSMLVIMSFVVYFGFHPIERPRSALQREFVPL